MALEALHNTQRKFVRNKYEDEDEVDSKCVLTNTHNLYIPQFSKSVVASGGYLKSENGQNIKINYEHGTTTLAFKYKSGVLVAVDSRATSGEYIGSGSVRKIIDINQYLVGTMAGGAADCTYWERVLSKHCRVYELRNRERISVAAASKVLANMLYQYKGYGLSVYVMIAGWDKKGPGLYYVDSEGNRMAGNMFSVGSGSLYAYGVADSGYHYDMTDEEAQELGRRAVASAAHRDAASGGIIRVCQITSDGCKMISEEDSKDLYYKYESQAM